MKRPVGDTLFYLKKRFRNRRLTPRKRFCFAFWEWKCDFGNREKLAHWVETAIALRKGEGRIGGKRTKLEKMARRHFGKVGKLKHLDPSRKGAVDFAKKQVEEGVGINSPEQQALRAERNRRNNQRNRERGVLGGGKTYVVTDPEGNEFVVYALQRWARNTGFTKIKQLWEIARGRKLSADGYKARFYDPVEDAYLTPNGTADIINYPKPKDWYPEDEES